MLTIQSTVGIKILKLCHGHIDQLARYPEECKQILRKSLINWLYIALVGEVPQMSLLLVKQQILETMLLQDKPAKAVDIAKAVQLEFPPVMMHILGLVRMGYVSVPEKGLYVITSKGKEALGIPAVTREKAIAILSYEPHDKSFEFYVDLGQPLHIHAHSLRDFAKKIEKVDAASVEFHTKRGDFEAWFTALGDQELTKKMKLLKQKNLSGDDLRRQLRQIVEQEYICLGKLAGQEIYLD